MKEGTQKDFQSTNHFFTSSENGIRDTGATSLSDLLKTNTTLTELYLKSKHKTTQTNQCEENRELFWVPIDNEIKYTGARSLSESLKSNTNLTYLNLECK